MSDTNTTTTAESGSGSQSQQPQPQPTSQQQPAEHEAEQRQPEPSATEQRLEAALAAERKQREATQRQLDELRKAAMSEQERAVAEAREAGRAEARRELSTAMLQAEIRARAAGKLSDPADAVRLLDVDELLADDGTYDGKAIDGKLDDLLKSKPYLAPAAANGSAPRPPQGVRETQPTSGNEADDFLRGLIRGK